MTPGSTEKKSQVSAANRNSQPTIITTSDVHIMDEPLKAVLHSENARGIQEEMPRLIEVYPDGGQGWLVCFAVFLMNFTAWGCNLALSIYVSHYISSTPEFSNLPRATISLISGSSLSFMLLIAPFSNYVENLVGVRNCVALGAVINSLGLYLASLSSSIGHLLLTQAILAGIGRGLMSTPCSYILGQWFDKRCTLATGIGHTGSGLGGMVFAQITHYFIENHGLNASYHASNAICSALAIPCVLFVKHRCPTIRADTGEPFHHSGKASVLSWRAIKSWIILIFFVRALFSQWAYSFIRAIIPTYYKQALGQSDEGAVTLQLIFSLGMAIGRPTMGLVSDKIGILLTAIVSEFIALLSYYVLWFPANSIIPIGIHSFIQGSLGGIFFLTALPITRLIAAPRDVRSVVTVIWLISALASILSLYFSLLIVDKAVDNGLSVLDSYRITIYFNSSFMAVAILLSVVLYYKIKRGKCVERVPETCEAPRDESDIISLTG